MSRFLIDVNLPRRFHLWATGDFEFAHDHDPSWSDAQLWDYARANDLSIVTVDSDFHDRTLVSQTGPKVIHLLLNNLRLRDWHPLMTKIWPTIRTLSQDHRLVVVYRDRIDVVL